MGRDRVPCGRTWSCGKMIRGLAGTRLVLATKPVAAAAVVEDHWVTQASVRVTQTNPVSIGQMGIARKRLVGMSEENEVLRGWKSWVCTTARCQTSRCTDGYPASWGEGDASRGVSTA
jgi:hypothetical protein